MKYHVDIYMPKTLQALAQATLGYYASTFRVGHHVFGRSVEKAFVIPTKLSQASKLIEVTTDENDSFVKALFRMPYDAEYDFVFSLAHHGLVVTAWLNSRTDTHRTLDAGAYARSPR